MPRFFLAWVKRCGNQFCDFIRSSQAAAQFIQLSSHTGLSVCDAASSDWGNWRVGNSIHHQPTENGAFAVLGCRYLYLGKARTEVQQWTRDEVSMKLLCKFESDGRTDQLEGTYLQKVIWKECFFFL